MDKLLQLISVLFVNLPDVWIPTVVENSVASYKNAIVQLYFFTTVHCVRNYLTEPPGMLTIINMKFLVHEVSCDIAITCTKSNLHC